MVSNNDIIIAVKNRKSLHDFCKENNISRSIVKGADFMYVLHKNSGDKFAVISCFPSNNGKFYAYKTEWCNNDSAMKKFFIAPMYRTFEKALKAVTKGYV